MKNGKLEIKDLTVEVDNKAMLSNINMDAKIGDVVAIVGPNGAGKSTLFKTIMHHFSTKITKGKILFDNVDITKKPTTKIALSGFYYLAQNPIELDGIKLIDLYKYVIDANNNNKRTELAELYTKIIPHFKQMNLDTELLTRYNNVNFSGGQKKKNELIQMFLKNNKVLLLDEIDSGCDVDSIKIIANIINKIKKDHIILLISHQEQLLKIIQPNKTYVIANRTIANFGDGKLLFDALKQGFNQYQKSSDKVEMDSIKDVF